LQARTDQHPVLTERIDDNGLAKGLMHASKQRQPEEQVLDFIFHSFCFFFWKLFQLRIQRAVQGQIEFASHAGVGQAGGLSVEDGEHRHDGETQRREPTVYVFHNFIPASVFLFLFIATKSFPTGSARSCGERGGTRRKTENRSPR
jgi:hypothetical protein